MSKGVEWALHGCLVLVWLPGVWVPASRLAAYYELPADYFTKQVQALTRAGVLESAPGPRGGVRLARAPLGISLMDVVAAVEGRQAAFHCTEIHRLGVDAEPHDGMPCTIAMAMYQAELAWRRALAGQSLADVAVNVEASSPGLPERVRAFFVRELADQPAAPAADVVPGDVRGR